MGIRAGALALAMLALSSGAARAESPFRCVGFAQAGAAEILCSHTDPEAPPQTCSFSWTLMATANRPSVVSGSFLLVRGVTNSVVYQGSGVADPRGHPVGVWPGPHGGGGRGRG